MGKAAMIFNKSLANEMGKAATIFNKRLATMLSEKAGEEYNKAIH